MRISNLIKIFSPVWPIVDFLWVMILFDLWNSCGLLDGLEIWHVYYRHLEVCHGFGFIHLSCLVSVLWLLEVDACFGALYELVWTCVDLMNFIDLLPLVQMAWNLVCRSCYECFLTMNFWGFIEMFVSWFELDLSVWSYEVLNCMLCTLCLMKW